MVQGCLLLPKLPLGLCVLILRGLVYMFDDSDIRVQDWIDERGRRHFKALGPLEPQAARQRKWEEFEKPGLTHLDASFPGVRLSFPFTCLDLDDTTCNAAAYKVHMLKDQGARSGSHFKLGWGFSGSNLHPGVWDSMSWSIGGTAKLCHGGNADPPCMGYVGKTYIMDNGSPKLAIFQEGDVLEALAIKRGSEVQLWYFLNKRPVSPTKFSEWCPAHVFLMDEYSGKGPLQVRSRRYQKEAKARARPPRAIVR